MNRKIFNNDFFVKNSKVRPRLIISVALILIFVFMAIFARFVAPYGPNDTDFNAPLLAPSLTNIFGTDELSRDVFSRMVYGLRISLFIGLVPTTINIVIGTLVGMYSGLSNKYIDSVIMRIVDIGLSYPFMILAMVIVYNFGTGVSALIVALVFFGWCPIARVIRAQTISISTLTYVEAARTMNANKWHIMISHILPSLKSTILVLYTMAIPTAILSEAGISFLGFGIQSPMTSLGLMVSTGKKLLFDAPWISIAPGIFILLLSMSFNILGDELRDILGVEVFDR